MSSVPIKTLYKSPAKKAHAVKSFYGGYPPMKGPAKAPAHKPTSSVRPSGKPIYLRAITAEPANKIASCEITPPAAQSEQKKRPSTADEAWAKMKMVRSFDGTFSNTSWTPKGVAALEACLSALEVWGIDDKLYDGIRQRLKKERGDHRALNKNNPYLVILHCCEGKLTVAQRKENSRFSKVIAVAHASKIKPEDAEQWLKSNSQAAVLGQYRTLKGKGEATHRPIIASKKVRPHIWNAIKAGEGKNFTFVMKQLDLLETKLATTE